MHTNPDYSAQKALNNIVNRMPGLNESLTKNDVDLSKQEEIHIFGYGSLVTKPHEDYTLSSTTTAYLWDYRRDMCCKCISLGTHKKTGLTLGIDQEKGAIVPGAILSYKGLSLDQKIDMLNKFADREVVTTLEIYKFKLMEVEKEDGTTVHAITCIADPEQTMGYAGDMLTEFETSLLSKQTLQDLSLRKQAHEIAWTNGIARSSGQYTTGKSYFDRFVRFPIENKRITTEPDASNKRKFALYREQQHMLHLAQYIDEEREHMRKIVPDYVAALEAREAEQLEKWKNSNAY